MDEPQVHTNLQAEIEVLHRRIDFFLERVQRLEMQVANLAEDTRRHAQCPMVGY